MAGIANLGGPHLRNCSPAVLRRESPPHTAAPVRFGSFGLRRGDSVAVLRSRDLLLMKAVEGSNRSVSVNGISVGDDNDGDKNSLDMNEVVSNGNAGQKGNFLNSTL